MCLVMRALINHLNWTEYLEKYPTPLMCRKIKSNFLNLFRYDYINISKWKKKPYPPVEEEEVQQVPFLDHPEGSYWQVGAAHSKGWSEYAFSTFVFSVNLVCKEEMNLLLQVSDF